MHHRSARTLALTLTVIVAPQGDNYGPADAAEVRDDFRLFGAVFPNASIIASTLGDFFDLIDGDPKLRSELPVLKSEVGDTWMCASPSSRARS
eukprot:COSAG04_NODE_11068_length_733_cov_0.949527_1_plen_93_part_00